MWPHVDDWLRKIYKNMYQNTDPLVSPAATRFLSQTPWLPCRAPHTPHTSKGSPLPFPTTRARKPRQQPRPAFTVNPSPKEAGPPRRPSSSPHPPCSASSWSSWRRSSPWPSRWDAPARASASAAPTRRRASSASWAAPSSRSWASLASCGAPSCRRRPSRRCVRMRTTRACYCLYLTLAPPKTWFGGRPQRVPAVGPATRLNDPFHSIYLGNGCFWQ